LTTTDAADYPTSVTAFGTRTNSYSVDVEMSVSGYVASISYEGTYNPDTAGV
jgi:hypothetical protein